MRGRSEDRCDGGWETRPLSRPEPLSSSPGPGRGAVRGLRSHELDLSTFEGAIRSDSLGAGSGFGFRVSVSVSGSGGPVMSSGFYLKPWSVLARGGEGCQYYSVLLSITQYYSVLLSITQCWSVLLDR